MAALDLYSCGTTQKHSPSCRHFKDVVSYLSRLDSSMILRGFSTGSWGEDLDVETIYVELV